MSLRTLLALSLVAALAPAAALADDGWSDDRSNDNGDTWSTGVTVVTDNGSDKEWLAIDRTGLASDVATDGSPCSSLTGPSR